MFEYLIGDMRERTLSDAMGHLLPTSAPPAWGTAVRHAARLLGPAWEQGAARRSELTALAYVLFAVGHQYGQDPATVSLDTVRTVLGEPSIEEPQELCAVVDPVIQALYPFDIANLREDPVRSVWNALKCLAYALEDSGDMPPGPSALNFAARRLRVALADLTDARAQVLPGPPEPAGLLIVHASGTISKMTAHSRGAVRCSSCDQYKGGALTVDGSDVFFTCSNGHISRDSRVEAWRVRNALDRVGLPTSGTHRLRSLDIASTVELENADTKRFFFGDR